MAIHVVCPGCHKRFQVSDKFAGKRGPCPKCKAEIRIPDKGEEVKVHAPETFGPKDKKGRAVLKPIFREETKFSPVMAISVGGAVLVVFLAALILRVNLDASSPQMSVVLGIGAVLLAPALVFAGYTFLRDDELEPHRGKSLWIRVGVCAAVFALLWGAVAYLDFFLYDGEGFGLWMAVILAALMILAGAGAAYVSMDFDFARGIGLYGMYLVVTILLRLVIGVGAFPVKPDSM